MKYGLYLANFGKETSPQAFVSLAQEAEASGWDGFFLWDHMLHSKTQRDPMVDSWITLAGIAASTSRIRLGTTLTPLSRRRPWKVARETASLDHLSHGRLTLSVGLGEPPDADFAAFGEVSDARIRAEMLDESLAILAGLWKGRAFTFQGQHYQVDHAAFLPKPLQQPRIPVWVGGWWPNPAPFRRAARWDGALPLNKKGVFLQPDDVRDLLRFVAEERKGKIKSSAPFDVAVINSRWLKGPRGVTGAEKAALYAEAGATWWLESLYMERNSIERLREAIRTGPPR